MFSFRTTPIQQQPDLILKGGKIGVLCNQTAWHPETGEYIFETYAKKGNLKRVFIPEHGLFGELQDQVKLDETSVYANLLQKPTSTGKEVTDKNKVASRKPIGEDNQATDRKDATEENQVTSSKETAEGNTAMTSYGEIEFVSLYGNSEESLYASVGKLEDLDALIIELQDVGCRYYTYISTVFNLFKVLKNAEIGLSVYIIEV